MTDVLRLAVLNPGGRDPEQRFDDGPGVPDAELHAPVNHHAFAACTRGSFHRSDTTIAADQKAVLLLLRNDLKACRQALIELRRARKTVAIAFKEAGALQVAAQLEKPAKLQLFREICARADVAIATTPDLVQLYTAAGARSSEFMPTPYPTEDARWDFSRPLEERRGIFLGTREFGVHSRNHLAALLAMRQLAEAMQEPVTVFNTEGWRGRRMLKRVGYPEGLLRVVEGRIPYPGYLKLMARHKLVFQLDASAVPGQVAGDALLSRVPCVGGNGTTDRLVFPDLCGHGRTTEQLFDLAARLLEHPQDCQFSTEQALELATSRLSFTRIAVELDRLFTRVAR